MPETPADNYAARRDRLRAAATADDLAAVLVTSLVNVRYLTGFTGSNGALLLRSDGADVFATDGRYRVQAAAQVPDLERVERRIVGPLLAERAAAAGVRRLGYESHVVTVDERDVLADAAGAASLVSVHRAVERLRAVKDAAEIDLVATACRIADDALAALLEAGGVRPGRTEAEVGRDLDTRMLDLGAGAVSFETIVASGPNSAIPHHRPADRPLATGDLVTFDFGAEYAGYHSDMTRTVVLGEPADWQAEIYALVAEAQRVGVGALEVGSDVLDIDRAARTVIEEAGHGADFGHGLGHGIGLEVHESPTLGPTGAGTLEESMLVTVEPGVYLEGRGGVRIEDTLAVRADGSRNLTHTTKDLLVR